MLFCICFNSIAYANEITQMLEIAPQYLHLSEIVNDDLIIARSHDKDELISPSYNRTIFVADTILAYNNGIIATKQNNTVVILDINGNVKFQVVAKTVNQIVDNKIVIVDESNNYYLYNCNGDDLLNDKYNSIICGNSNNVLLKTNNEWILFDINNKNTLLNIKDIGHTTSTHIVCSLDGDSYGVIDYTGKTIAPFNHQTIQLKKDYIYGTKTLNNKKISVCYDLEGKTIYEEENAICSEVSSGLYGVVSDNLCCYKNLNGEITLDLSNLKLDDRYKITYLGGFYDDFARIGINDGYTYINHFGEIVTDNFYAGAYNFAKGYALVYNELYSSSLEYIGKQWYIIDKQFLAKPIKWEIIVDFKNDENCTDFSNNYVRTYDRETWLVGYMYLAELENTNHEPIYNLCYYSNGGNGVMNKMILKDGEFIDIPKCNFVYNNHTFRHWTDGENIYYPGDEFIMPAHDVTLTAVWKEKPKKVTINTINYSNNKKEVKLPYTDLENHWSKEYVELIHEHKLVDGVTETEFEPDKPMTREVFVTALARLSGVKENCIDWAIEIELLKGYGNDDYGLDDTVTREQMAVFFERYLNIAEVDIDSMKTVERSEFADDETISDWAKESVYTMQEITLIKGKNGNKYDPLGLATRAEGTTVLYNLIKAIENK